MRPYHITIKRSDHNTPDTVMIYAQNQASALKFVRNTYRTRLLGVLDVKRDDVVKQEPAHAA